VSLLRGKQYVIPRAVEKVEKPGPENGRFRSEKLKTKFQCVIPAWEQIKNMSDIF